MVEVFNHSLFWDVISPEGKGDASSELTTAINEAGSFESLRPFSLMLLQLNLVQVGLGYVKEGGKLSFARLQIKIIL